MVTNDFPKFTTATTNFPMCFDRYFRYHCTATLFTDIIALNRSFFASSQNSYPIEAAMQRPCWELDHWEFAGGEEEMIGDPMPRLVFGGVPTIEEAREATSQLKDALDKYNFLYLELGIFVSVLGFLLV